MTVRWKPLILLSGLFLVIAVVGVLVLTLDLVPADASEILPVARREWKKGKYENAQIHFLRALQNQPKDSEIHAELARMYEEWGRQVKDPARRAKLRVDRLGALADAAKHGKDAAPRRELLADALLHNDTVQSVLWAKKLLDLDANDPDARFALAADALTGAKADPGRASEHLAVLRKRQPERLRTRWLELLLANQTGRSADADAILENTRSAQAPEGADTTDRAALLELRQLDALAATEQAEAARRAEAFRAEADRQSAEAVPPARLVRVAQAVREIQRHLRTVSASTPGAATGVTDPISKELDAVAERCYDRAVEATASGDLAILLEYADYLLFRDRRDQCLDLVDRALKLPVARIPAWSETVGRLRETAIRAALMDEKDEARFDKAKPHLDGLLAATDVAQQALGHLFLGVIELERSGLAADALSGGAERPDSDPKLRASAVAHLKQAAAGLPEVATAQALYGVALLLSGESALGRQYLIAAQRLPGLEPRYRVWSAWAMLQAGYPEEAEPIIAALRAEAEKGNLAADLMPTLRVLTGEIYQASNTPDGLKLARAAYDEALAAGQPRTAALELRMAQIDVMQGDADSGLKRIEALRADGQGGASAEHLAVLILGEQARNAAARGDKAGAEKSEQQARATLDAARKAFPDSAELVNLDAALLVRQQKAAEADRTLADFLAAHPNQIEVVQTRARLLAAVLKQPDEARKVLAPAAEVAETSGPLVQLALLDIERGEHPAVVATIAKVRARWKEAAAADLLDAQLALAKQEPKAAMTFLQEALKKDPSNKLALFWKAQLDDRAGASSEAAKAYETIARDNPVKEVDDGLSLATAANWALATLALQNRDVDAAITRLEGLLQGGGLDAGTARPVRWQLATAHAAKGEWPKAKAEVEALLKDPATTLEERLRAANLHRMHGDSKQAAALLDGVLKEKPGEPAAVALRSYMLAETEPAAAAALIRRAIAAGKQPASLYLMLGAIENMIPPLDTGLKRAQAAIDEGLAAYPDAVELVQARYRVTRMSGDAEGARAFVEARTKDDPKGSFRRLLVDIDRDEGRYEQAYEGVRSLLKDQPNDPALSLLLVRLVSARAVEAANRGDRQAERKFNDEASSLIRASRAANPDDARMLEAEAELAARTGSLDRALALSKQIDEATPTSPAGPVLRARLATARGWSEGTAKEYAEAVARAPQRADLRLSYGQASLAVGRTDEAVRQAEWLLQADGDDPSALLLKARALTDQDGSEEQVKARRAQAIALLQEALKGQPRFTAAHRLIAEIRDRGGDRPGALQALRDALKADPNDSAALSQLVQLLTSPDRNGHAPEAARVQEAVTLAERLGGPDQSGNHALAASIGFHRAGLFDQALPWAKTAAERLDSWVAHLNYGDLLLARAESAGNPQQARGLFEQALDQYDLVLKQRANSVEAVNNKAWILMEYLDRAPEALEVAEGFMKRNDPSILPADFFDTLGAIQERLERRKDAEASYALGLKRDAEHPVLNFHMARLLATDSRRSRQAGVYLDRAMAARDRLPGPMAVELDSLHAKLTR